MTFCAPNINRLRIIGGKWRSRILHFPEIEGLRPTPDRVRETVFNWLAPSIRDAICLDLFAGSGALGFEALSRGARSVTMVDQSPQAIAGIQKNAQILGAAEQITLYCGQVPKLELPLQNGKFNIIFLDPPFHKNWIASSIQWLERTQCLADQALIYIEAESELQPLPIPAHWGLLRSKKAGRVGYHLATSP